MKKNLSSETIKKHIKLVEKIIQEKEINIFLLHHYFYHFLCDEAISVLKKETKTRVFKSLLKYFNFTPKEIRLYEFIIQRCEELEIPIQQQIKTYHVPKFLNISDYQYKKLIKEEKIIPIDHDHFSMYGKSLSAPIFDLFEIGAYYGESVSDPTINLKRIKNEVKPFKLDLKKKQLTYSVFVSGVLKIELAVPIDEITKWDDYDETTSVLRSCKEQLESQRKLFENDRTSREILEFIASGVSLYWNEKCQVFSENENDGVYLDLNGIQKFNLEKATAFFDILPKVGFNKFTVDLDSFNFLDEIPAMKNKKRKFVFILGDTNSGKTYEALTHLKNAETGVYLSPIRLLSYEKYDELSSLDLNVDLKTGEEVILNPLATHHCSTIELVDPNEEYEVGIIDEIQMIGDFERGRSWLKAVLSLNADTVYVLGSYDFYLRQSLIEYLKQNGFNVEVRHKTRLSSLTKLNVPVTLKDLQDGDTIIAFDKNTLFCLAAEMEKKGVTCSVLFGDLSYERKLEEIGKFKHGYSKVLIATDVIAMGINMPIKRVLFYKTYKYNYGFNQCISNQLFKQIVGRAGRYKENGFYGIYSSNFVDGFLHENDLMYLKSSRTKEFNKLANEINTVRYPDREMEKQEELLNTYSYGFDREILKNIYLKMNKPHFYQVLKLYQSLTPFDHTYKSSVCYKDLILPHINLLNEIVASVGVEKLFHLLSFNNSTCLFSKTTIEDWENNLDYENMFIEEKIADILKRKKALSKITHYKNNKEVDYDDGWSYYVRDLSRRDDYYDYYY